MVRVRISIRVRFIVVRIRFIMVRIMVRIRLGSLWSGNGILWLGLGLVLGLYSELCLLWFSLGSGLCLVCSRLELGLGLASLWLGSGYGKVPKMNGNELTSSPPQRDKHVQHRERRDCGLSSWFTA